MTQQQVQNSLAHGYTIAEDKEDGFLCLCLLAPRQTFYWGWRVTSRVVDVLLQRGVLQQDACDADYVFYRLTAFGEQLCLPFQQRRIV